MILNFPSCRIETRDDPESNISRSLTLIVPEESISVVPEVASELILPAGR